MYPRITWELFADSLRARDLHAGKCWNKLLWPFSNSVFLLGAIIDISRPKRQKVTTYAADSKRWTQIKSLHGRSVERNVLLQRVELREESLLGHCTTKRDKPKQITNDQRRNSGGFYCETCTVMSSVYKEDLHFAYKVTSLPSGAG